MTWFEHIGAIRWKTKLTARLREIAIVRVAQVARYAYALNQHVPTIAVPDGVSLEECEALKDWRPSKFFNEAERAALAYVDAMIAGPEVPDDVFNAVRKHYNEREIVELTVLVGTYLMHNRVFTALRVDVEPKKN
jgi:alkylhydroperoxidase family enzyme